MMRFSQKNLKMKGAEGRIVQIMAFEFNFFAKRVL